MSFFSNLKNFFLPKAENEKLRNNFQFEDGNIIQFLKVKEPKEVYSDPQGKVIVFRLDVIASGSSSSKTTMELLSKVNDILDKIIEDYKQNNIVAVPVIVGDLSKQQIVLSTTRPTTMGEIDTKLFQKCLKMCRIETSTRIEKSLTKHIENLNSLSEKKNFAVRFENINELNAALNSYIRSPEFQSDLQDKLSSINK